MKIEFEGIEELIRQLETMSDAVDQGKVEALIAGAQILQKAVQGRAPYLTGILMEHIIISDVKDGEIDVYVDQQGPAYYGYFHEFGTSRMPARPFVGPAFNESGAKIEQAIANVLRMRMGLVA
jgi:HK97 gp10 family phage protein